MIEILTDNHYDKIMDLFESAKQQIRIISPFLTMNMARKLCDIVKKHDVECIFITRFYLEDMFAKVNSIDAIEIMMDSGIQVYALKGLHTKLYLFDDKAGVVGSANFTSGGFISNFELSLMAMDEPILLSDLQIYYNDLLLSLQNSNEGLITKEVLCEARIKYQSLLDGKKSGHGITKSVFMYGAELKKKKYISVDDRLLEINACIGEKDIVYEVFRENTKEIKYEHTIWLKFDGEGNDRIDSQERFPMINVKLKGKKVFIQNYPFKVRSIQDGDEVYLAAITTDTKGKNQPVIIGRGIMRGFMDENEVLPLWIQQFGWMERFPYYCIMDNATVLNTNVANGIPLSAVWDELGSDTYIASFGRNESIVEVARKHYQKAHIRLSGNAKQYIDRRLSELEEKYGVVEYISER